MWFVIALLVFCGSFIIATTIEYHLFFRRLRKDFREPMMKIIEQKDADIVSYEKIQKQLQTIVLLEKQNNKENEVNK